ncbi:DUF689-domain-containing protein [Eremomyces bilateralis CBS 781.70]|uniref:DUF689-domain-containing protein n=1 Tax=Eremomyces bilateralis CBS 781.70 TaxID=1392243 RepID=A0A6G1FZ76_9PEZI|nr:DUF689-domain-containing protein [Eremomyces bilateralis CBS 781.70]KAF1811094.1 DUF689-domain-containing protein [Eremomyces bilateralis CBS 781.70]
MAPHFVLEDSSIDFSTPSHPHTTSRTLLLAPPSLSSHPDALAHLFAQHPRSTSDLQMLDRLVAGLVALPTETYDLVLLVASPESSVPDTPLTRDVMARVLAALKPGGRFKSQSGRLGEVERREGILGGLAVEGEELVKPTAVDSGAVPLRFGRRKPVETVAINGKRKTEDAGPVQTTANGVGFVDFDNNDELIITGEDDDIIDEDEFITEEDMTRPVIEPPECRPKPGKKRRACKDCSCGLAQQIAAEDAATRSEADAKLQTFQLGADDLAEVDFTVQGKVGSCGNCALGDAFRCDGCPYVGLPPFKPGEEVRLVNDEVQL